MLYAVSFSNGLVGVYTSMDIITENVFNIYKGITFVTQVFFSTNEEEDKPVWVIFYKDSENIAYVTDNAEKAKKYKGSLCSIGKSYEDSIDYWELQTNMIVPHIEIILENLNRAYMDTSPIGIDSTDNVIEYNK